MKLNSIGVLCFVLSLFANVVSAANHSIMIDDAWIREAPPNAKSLAGYMVIKNHSNKKQTLQSASSSAFGMVMMHRSEQKNGMAHMTHQKQITIPAMGKVTFAPGGYHLMLMKPKKSLKSGDHVMVTLVFADKTKLSVNFKVRKGMSMKHDGGMDHEGMKHEGMKHEGMKHEGMKHEGMKQEGMNHEGMKH